MSSAASSHSATSVDYTQEPTGGEAQGLDINAFYMALSPLNSRVVLTARTSMGV